MRKRKADTTGHRANKHCSRCGCTLRRFWYFCPDCGKNLVWGDERGVTGAECFYCGWVVSDSFSHCPWCGRDISDEASSDTPLKRPRGFQYHGRCDYTSCRGGLQYPMHFCPWCGRGQHWPFHNEYEGVCPHCDQGVDDLMDYCPWCGHDATGQDQLWPAIRRVRHLLRKVHVPDWGYRILVRPGISGVDPKYPKIVEIERRYVNERAQIDWPSLVGLVTHELGHSFMFHHWRFARSDRFRRAFGDVSKAYRGVDESWVQFRRRNLSETPVNHVTAYASKHPLEDFAETFRFYVIRRGRLKDLLAEIGRLGKGVIVYEKFLTLHAYIQELRRKSRQK
ncbi:MAG: putative zinc-binding metallopeptidase [Gemmatimonadota bacterium]|nr:MAG: putative zinc-binding metallopeptidase [Gemmatimonadota bacterium]